VVFATGPSNTTPVKEMATLCPSLTVAVGGGGRVIWGGAGSNEDIAIDLSSPIDAAGNPPPTSTGTLPDTAAAGWRVRATNLFPPGTGGVITASSWALQIYVICASRNGE
jgi:hypothetical protein